ncbi:MAG: filamentous hemagglutinin N-terminal domain-containing protein, partial [Desulfuromonadaceae bacterium]|nr:filamentous hemagglutinin N-terminal domain-containing protein [Desulfuromonadaceae bacterium]
MKRHHTRAKLLNQNCPGSSRNHHLLNDVVHLVAEKFKGALMPVGVPVGILTLLSALSASPAHALPQNGAVVGGTATISQPNPTTMNINQTSGNAIINWRGYNIGANESVRYSQPGSSSIILNRITGGDPSYIYGLLSGNGQVWVINPNGLLVGPGATIQTGSFLASTMNITNDNFLSGKHIFTSAPDSRSSVVNQGSISAAQGGYVVLAAPSVTNSGSIVANVGSVHLASGDTVTLSLDNGNLINVAVNGDVAASALGVTNTGRITANGGQVVLSARVAGDVMKSVVNNEGIIEAQSTIEHNGAIILDNGDGGITANSGVLDASGKNPGETGGSVTVLGNKVGLFAGSSIDVSGDAGGGTVLIGGNFHGAGAEKNASMTYVDKDAAIQADALTTGAGGKVAVWADDATQFYGTISAKGGVRGGDGGFVEVSGKHRLTYAGLVNLSAPKGATGTLLLDPDDITIVHATDASLDTATIAPLAPFVDTSTATPSSISDFTINSQLGTASVTIKTSTDSITSLPGVDITLNSNTLTLQSAADINLAGTYRGAGTLNLNFASTLDLTTAPAFVGGPAVNATGGGTASIIKATGQTWTLSGNDQGSVAGLTFTNAGNLADAGTGAFNMGTDGSLTGNLSGVTGGTLNYSTYTTPVTLDLAGNNTTGIGGSWSGITTVTGNAATSNTVTGSSKTYTLTGVNAGNSSGVSWSSFGTIADSGTGMLSTAGTQTYNLTGLNTGTVTTLLPGGFTGIGTLSSTGAATFFMGTDGSVTGNLDGGTGGVINYGSYTTPITLDLAGTGTTGIGGSWSHIATVTGTSSIGDTIRGLGKTYTLDSSIADKGSSSGVTWSAFENITDTGAGIFKFGAAGSVTGNITAAGGRLDYTGHTTAAHVTLSGNSGMTTGIGGTWSGIASVTGSANSGDTISGASQTYTLDNTVANKGSNGVVTWTAVENLTDTGTGIFNMGSGGKVSGNLDGGVNGTLDYSGYTTPVTLNLASTTGTTGIGGAWSHISTVTGNANSNTVVGSNKTYVLDNSIANKGSNGGVTWTGFNNISDTGTGVFSMGSGGSVTGNLNGGLGGTINYSTYTNPVTLNLAGTATSGIGGSWSNIATVTGSSNNDTVSGMGKIYNLTAANAGNSGGVSWTSFEKIA